MTKNEKQETRVICPVCGSEFDVLDKHEHKVKNATVLGVDSGIGIIELPVKKRGEALKAAGIDISKYFSIQIPGGGEQMMKKTDDGGAVPVSADDPIIKAILGSGTVPNRNLFRRWVMSQVFHGLTAKDYHRKPIGFTEWLNRHGYKYQWTMLLEELRVQARLFKNGDMENYRARNRWFNQELAYKMAVNHIEQMREDAMGRPQHKCKGVPYVQYDSKNYFVTDIDKKLIAPMRLLKMKLDVNHTKSPQKLYEAVRDFVRGAHLNVAGYFKQCQEWKDAYKGMGAYATMQNLLRFHDCKFPKDNDFYNRNDDGLDLLELAAKTYADGEGWRLFGLMRQMIEENHIDIEAKMREWARAKARK
jgi:hypothetical protein